MATRCKAHGVSDIRQCTICNGITATNPITTVKMKDMLKASLDKSIKENARLKAELGVAVQTAMEHTREQDQKLMKVKAELAVCVSEFGRFIEEVNYKAQKNKCIDSYILSEGCEALSKVSQDYEAVVEMHVARYEEYGGHSAGWHGSELKCDNHTHKAITMVFKNKRGGK